MLVSKMLSILETSMVEDVLMDLVFILAVAIAASFINTLTGFGYALITMPAWILVMDPKAAVVLTQLSFMFISPPIAWKARKEVDRGLLAVLLPCSYLGLPLGTYVLAVIDEETLRLAIGIAIVVAALLMLFNYQRPFADQRRSAAVTGFLMGILTNSIMVSGPLVVLFMANQSVGKDRFRATVAAFLTGMVPVSLVMLAAAGLVTGPLISTVPPLLLPCIAGYILADRVLPFVNQEAFRRVTVALVLFAGLSLVASEICRIIGV